ncbi:hypothetical protein GC170_09255 [bacterium]|nr:hypothetical protein [bacterium]
MRPSKHPEFRRVLARFLYVSGISACLCSGMAFGQSSYNPYEQNSSQFRNFARPGGSNPFESMSGNRSQSSTFQQEMDKLFGGRETSSGLSRDKQRYYNAFRKYDEEFDRLYRPNVNVDQAYNERRSTRESVYFKAFREKDPRKRADLMKAFERGEDMAAIRDDSKPDEAKAAESRKTTRGTDRNGILGPNANATEEPRKSGVLGNRAQGTSSTKNRSSSRGLLGSRDEPGADSDNRSNSSDKESSLTERGRRFSEKIRPGAAGTSRTPGRPYP